MPLDMTEQICGVNIQDVRELESILRREGFVSTPYNFLCGGHNMNEFQLTMMMILLDSHRLLQFRSILS